ncbi:MAG: cupredoxin domain-containing protein [Patescibacteria group bacterium]
MKSNATAIILAGVLIGGAILLVGGSSNPGQQQGSTQNNIAVTDGTQVITIKAKGGYAPRETTAKADIPTTLRIETNGTFDCSSALTIPALRYRANLPPSGTTEIKIPPQNVGATIKGICAMGMYNFAITFEK